MTELEFDMMQATTLKELKRIIEDNYDKMTNSDWYRLIKSPGWSNQLIDTYSEKLQWDSLCVFKTLTVDILERYIDKLDWYAVSCFQPLTVDFINKYVHKLSLNRLIYNEKIGKDAQSLARKLYAQYDDPPHHKVWDINLSKCIVICPKNFKGKFTDYDENTPLPGEEKVGKTPAKKSVKKEKSKKEVKPIKIDYSTLSKAELKEILAKRNVRVYYHDTLAILREKCQNSEK